MVPLIAAAAIAAIASLIGAAIASGDNAKAQALRLQAAEKFKDIPLPELDRIIARTLPPGAAERYLKVTEAQQAQGDVLAKLREMVAAKGETPEDRAAYLRMQAETARIARASESGIMRDMNARGLGGSGVELALRNQGMQGAINRANEMGVQSAADARTRYLQSLAQTGAMAGQVRSQELDALKAQDAINMFNARAAQDADRHNAGLAQQRFDNEMMRAQGYSGAVSGVAGGYDRGADRTRETAGGLGQAAMTVGGALEQDGLTEEERRRRYLKGAGAS